MGEFPTRRHLKALGKDALARAISKKYGGFAIMREISGYDVIRRPYNYWQNLGTILTNLKEIIAKEYKKYKKITKSAGEFPSLSFLDSIGRTDLRHAIVKYHRGIIKLRKTMGYENKRCEDGYFKKWENLEAKLKEIANSEMYSKDNKLIKKAGEFPTRKQLKLAGKNYLCNHIQRYHGGSLEAIREKIRHTNQRHARKPENTIEISSLLKSIGTLGQTTTEIERKDEEAASKHLKKEKPQYKPCPKPAEAFISDRPLEEELECLSNGFVVKKKRMPSDRQIFWLYTILEKTPEEIAKMFGGFESDIEKKCKDLD
jgi:hypothetical protein